MPEISVRGLEMPESPIRKLAPLAAAAKKAKNVERISAKRINKALLIQDLNVK